MKNYKWIHYYKKIFFFFLSLFFWREILFYLNLFRKKMKRRKERYFESDTEKWEYVIENEIYYSLSRIEYIWMIITSFSFSKEDYFCHSFFLFFSSRRKRLLNSIPYIYMSLAKYLLPSIFNDILNFIFFI